MVVDAGVVQLAASLVVLEAGLAVLEELLAVLVALLVVLLAVLALLAVLVALLAVLVALLAVLVALLEVLVLLAALTEVPRWVILTVLMPPEVLVLVTSVLDVVASRLVLLLLTVTPLSVLMTRVFVLLVLVTGHLLWPVLLNGFQVAGLLTASHPALAPPPTVALTATLTAAAAPLA